MPTVTEAGFDIDMPSWSGIYAPKGTPPAIIERIGAAVREIVAAPEMQERIVKIGFFPIIKTPAELAAQFDGDVAAHADWVKRTGFKIE